jgi:hypothetical protein
MGIRWVEYEARREEMRNAYKILVGKPEGMDHSEELGVDKVKVNLLLCFN